MDRAEKRADAASAGPEDREREEAWLVSRINGYVSAMAAMDGQWGDSIAEAHLVSLAPGALPEALGALYAAYGAVGYRFGAVETFQAPWSRNFHGALECFFLQTPFGCRPEAFSDQAGEQLSATRYSLIFWIVDMVLLVAGPHAAQSMDRVELTTDDGYSGWLYVLPLANRALLIRTLTRGDALNPDRTLSTNDRSVA